jgi:predicted transcriptional regulator
VKDLLLNNLEITKAELLQIEARNRSTGSVSQADILKLAAETEAVWQRHVKACVHDSIPVLDSGDRYSWIAEMYGSDSETNGTGSETDENDSEFT